MASRNLAEEVMNINVRNQLLKVLGGADLEEACSKCRGKKKKQ